MMKRGNHLKDHCRRTMTTPLNIKSSVITVIFCGYILVFLYTVIAHKLYQQHALIHVTVYKLRDNIDSLMPTSNLSLPKSEVILAPAKTFRVRKEGKLKSVKKVVVKKKVNISSLPDVDLMEWQRPQYSSDFRNPCWFDNNQKYKPTSCRTGVLSHIRIKKISNPRLRCLPYFYIVGQPRSGLHNIYNRLIHHPDIIHPSYTDNFWLERHRFVPGCSTVDTYLNYFHGVSQKILANGIKNKKTNATYYSKLTGDYSGDIMWDNTRWSELSRNKDCKEPCLTNADYIKHLNPSAKIIISLRDPVERLYSDYLAQSEWMKYTPQVEDFNKIVFELIYSFQSCLEADNSLRTCIYSSRLQNAYSKVRLGIGLYSIYLEDWYQVFSKYQIHVIHFENYLENTEKEMSRLFRFLGLRQLTKGEWKRVMAEVPMNRRTNEADEGEMWTETRKSLTEFYKPFNEALAELLHDTKFLWGNKSGS